MPMPTIDALCTVCVTRQHEYVLYGSSCVAVRERASGAWLDDHHAIEERVVLVPAPRRAHHLGAWDLEIHSFGLQIHVGPVLAVEEPDAAVKVQLEELVQHGMRLPRRVAGSVTPSDPG